MLSTLLFSAPLLLAVASPALAAPAAAKPNSERDLICFEAVTETVTVAVTSTVCGSPGGQQAPSPSAVSAAPSSVVQIPASPVTITASLVIPTNPSSSVSTAAAQQPDDQQQASSVAAPAPSRSAASQPDQPAASSAPDMDHERQYKNVLYFTNWGIYGAEYHPQMLDVSKVTHLLYAFADIASDGEVRASDSWSDVGKHYDGDSWNDQGNNAYGCIKQLFIHKKRNRHLKVLLSIGGWTYSPKFAPVAATEAGRQRFASSAVKLVADWGFDGLDIDWEYPANAAEARNFVLLLQACRRALDEYAAKNAKGYRFLITVASPAGPQNYKNMDLEGMDPYVDTWNLMAYDYAGSWDSTSGHQANLFVNPQNAQATKFSTEQAVHDYVARGIHPRKITLGMPLYGRSFEATSGLGQPYNGIGGGSVQSGVWLYKHLPPQGATEEWDDVAGASYSYDKDKRELITYDNRRSATVKSRYLKDKGLGGAVFWEASGDRTGAESLVGTVAGEMGRLDQTPNWLSYPASQYDNIRSGMPNV